MASVLTTRALLVSNRLGHKELRRSEYARSLWPRTCFRLARNSATHHSTIRNETRMQMNTVVPMLGLALASATASAQKVTYDYDKGTDFTKIRTYAWVHTREEVQDELNHKRIVAAVDSQLAAKG